MKEFEYSGLHFVPLSQKLKGDFFTITRRCRSVGIGSYPWSTKKYNYEEFYRIAETIGGGRADLFLCIEDGAAYIPCANELMQYLNKNGSAYRPNI